MTVYHVETQEDYNALMIELEEQGYKWRGGEKLTDFDEFSTHGKDTYVYEECCEISISSGDYFKKHYRNVPVIEYKAKREEMTQQEETKQNILDLARDVSVAVESVARDMYEVEADLKEAKSSAKKIIEKIIEKIDKYSKSVNPKFKKGDIVASKIFTDDSLSFIQLNQDLNNWCNSVDGFWYIKRDYKVYDRSLVVFKEDTRHATQSEIEEYEAALTFHKHGREPFEVKKDDILLEDGHYKFFVDDPENWGKEDFVSGGYTFAKTVEEVNEWLENK